jgi:septum formation protein
MLRMSGRMGVLHTGHWLVDCRDTDPDSSENSDGTGAGSGATLGSVTSAEVHFMEMSSEEIEAYIATGEPLQCAGSFTIDGYGGAFIRKVDGDPHTVVGLSISTLRGLLGQAQVGITELWTGGAVDPAEVRAE